MVSCAFDVPTRCEAKIVKARTDISVWIYQADIGFDPLINHTYHLYEKDNGKHFLSMVSPKEWGRSKKFKRFIATVKLLADHTWDVIEKGNKKQIMDTESENLINHMTTLL